MTLYAEPGKALRSILRRERLHRQEVLEPDEISGRRRHFEAESGAIAHDLDAAGSHQQHL